MALDHAVTSGRQAEACGQGVEDSDHRYARRCGQAVPAQGRHVVDGAHAGDGWIRTPRNRLPCICTVNEPGNMITRGCLDTFPTTPFVRDLDAFDDAAAAGLNAAHRAAWEVIRELAPGGKVGMTHAMQDWHADPGGIPVMRSGSASRRPTGSARSPAPTGCPKTTRP
ncbi:hypothetical protein AB0F15_38890 [Amycolatopsis sp. NPDC026612]|uniref:hypothetical protein n=1 Tax=Amycolatopsis sp. NPDC026612 TaxID=3155466 RepID=UPI00340F662D